jgi:hypothetical protein
VFEKDDWTDPTHSMLSKDHFSVSCTLRGIKSHQADGSRTSSTSLRVRAQPRCFTGLCLSSWTPLITIETTSILS